MRVIVPYATLWPETKAALEADGRQCEYIYVGGSPTAYHDLIAGVWAEGHAFTVIEQDIAPYPGAVAELEACLQPWCGHPYWIGTTFGTYLGCTRFSEEFVHANPGVMDECVAIADSATPPKYWGRVDTRLGQVLNDHYGLTVHNHYPAVDHLNPDKALRGGINCTECGEPIAWKAVMRTPPPWPCEHDGPPIPEYWTKLAPRPVEAGPAVFVNCSTCGDPMPCGCNV